MSRAASSLAVNLADYDDAPPPRRTSEYHLLGHHERPPATTRRHDFELRISNFENKSAIRNSQLDIVDEERDYEAVAVQPSTPHTAFRIPQFFRWQRVAVGLAVALFALILLGLVVSPVLARAASSESLRIRLSGYSELQGQVAPQGDAPPVGDVSTQPQPAPQPAPPQDQPPPPA